MASDPEPGNDRVVTGVSGLEKLRSLIYLLNLLFAKQVFYLHPARNDDKFGSFLHKKYYHRLPKDRNIDPYVRTYSN